MRRKKGSGVYPLPAIVCRYKAMIFPLPCSASLEVEQIYHSFRYSV
ncbi:hypothetical protein MNB_SV-6-1564 [hydrothermal vent metagenome]|uniref:Uncharacterized protein n=1 Tax=hydrothermal vent metagenome TaxID=652676 RepID=A0A1W1CFC5_9ZZZZ